MIDFNKNSVFNLSMIREEDISKEVYSFLIEDETIYCAFKTLRDQLIFTNKRIISIDAIGITGKGKSYSSLPYSKVQFFSVQTPGLTTRPDKFTYNSSLHLFFTNGFTAQFDFKDGVDIFQICKAISTFVMN